jgi:hypothetical protein
LIDAEREREGGREGGREGERERESDTLRKEQTKMRYELIADQ